jgi:hypothetical protein
MTRKQRTGLVRHRGGNADPGEKKKMPQQLCPASRQTQAYVYKNIHIKTGGKCWINPEGEVLSGAQRLGCPERESMVKNRKQKREMFRTPLEDCLLSREISLTPIPLPFLSLLGPGPWAPTDISIKGLCLGGPLARSGPKAFAGTAQKTRLILTTIALREEEEKLRWKRETEEGPGIKTERQRWREVG